MTKIRLSISKTSPFSAELQEVDWGKVEQAISRVDEITDLAILSLRRWNDLWHLETKMNGKARNFRLNRAGAIMGTDLIISILRNSIEEHHNQGLAFQ